MLSRTIRRALLDSRAQLPLTFLLPWSAGLSTVSHTTDEPNAPPPPPQAPSGLNTRSDGNDSARRKRPSLLETAQAAKQASISDTLDQDYSQSHAQLPSPSSTRKDDASPLQLSESVRELLPLMQAQGPHYITAHIHGNPYLLTEGDTVRLPFHMHGVEPGDVIRLNRAINLGSRDFTLKAPAPAPKVKSPATSSTLVVDPTTGSLASHSQVMPTQTQESAGAPAPHFIPHIAKGKYSYVDDRLFVCRAVVMGVESEPLRIKEKTKRRQRHVRKVKSKHRFTLLKIRELRIKTAEEIESGDTHA